MARYLSLLIAILLPAIVNAATFINGVEQVTAEFEDIDADITGLSALVSNNVLSDISVSNHLGTLQSQYGVSSNTVTALVSTQGYIQAALTGVSNHLDTLQSQYSVSSNTVTSLVTTQGDMQAALTFVSNSIYVGTGGLQNAFIKQVLTNSPTGQPISNNLVVNGGAFFLTANTSSIPLHIGNMKSVTDQYGSHTDQTFMVFLTGHSGTNAGTGPGTPNARDPSLYYEQSYMAASPLVTNYDFLGIDFRNTKEIGGWGVRGDKGAYLVTIRTQATAICEFMALYSPDANPNNVNARQVSFGQVPNTEADFGISTEKGITGDKYVLYGKVNNGGNIQNLYLGGSTSQYNVATTMRGNLELGTNYVVGNASSNGIRWKLDGTTNIMQVFQGSVVGLEIRF